MWKFSNMSSGSTLWPPDVAQQQNSYSMLYPTSDNPYGCSLSANPSVPFPVVEAQESFFHFNSSFPLPLNPLAFNPAIGFSGQAAADETKRFLVFDHSGDQTSLVYSSVANPFEGLNPALPASNATNAYASNGHVNEEEEMHEDTEEIDALLYSDDTEYIDDEEASTGHSPLDIEGEVVDNSHFQVKRRRVGSAELDASVVDTASSAIAPDGIELKFVGDIGKGEGKDRSSRKKREKRERILETVSVLRRIIPGGKGKDTASVLDEAILYLKSLKLRAKVMGGTASTP